MTLHRLPPIILPGILVGILAFSFLRNIGSVQFHPDESRWIATSQVFEEYFSGDFDSPYFADAYRTRTQPPLARYIIGGSRWLRGFTWDDLNSPWNFAVDRQANIDVGAMPSGPLLWWSRLPMAVLAVISFILAYALIVRSGGNVAGAIWLILCATSSYFLIYLRRAMAESALLICLSLAMVACYRILLLLPRQASGRGSRLFAWFAVLGACCGAAGAAKLSGLAALPVGIILAVIAAVKLPAPGLHKVRRGVLASITVVLVGLFAFFGLNPYLWPDPVGRARLMLEQRTTEMAGQTRRYPVDVIHGLDERARIIPSRVFQDHATIRSRWGFAVNVALFAVGMFSSAARSWRWLVDSSSDPAALTLLLFALTAAVPPLLTPLDWSRYFVLPVFFSTIFIAIGAGAIAAKTYDAVSLRLSQARGGSDVQAMS